ncbi:MAG: HK97 family phage prohead protease [Mangrovicoccus sp.]|nr:HK97 family phage prohead protease [Mangrovicoccus sp.]
MFDAGKTPGLEQKFCRFDDQIQVTDGTVIEGYASLFGSADQSGDIVVKGAYAKSLAAKAAAGRAVKLLWQHDPAQPIGIWDEIREEERGLYVKGRLLTEVTRAQEAACLIAAGALDGLSIGYRTIKASRNEQGQRLLTEVDLWEVSVVTFPMLPEARIGAKAEPSDEQVLRDLATAMQDARRALTGAGRTRPFPQKGA